MKTVKLIKQKYYGKKGEEKTCCFHVNLSKSIIQEAKFENVGNVKVYVQDGKIIIEKA